MFDSLVILEQLVYDIVFIGKGIVLTLQLLAGGSAIGFFFGILFAILRYKGILPSIINLLISIIRRTPLILQLSLLYYTAPGALGLELSIAQAGIVAFGFNSSAYFAEIFKAGIESLPKGQFEAARTLKIPTFYIWKDIILPQVMRNIFPVLINQLISLLKETALIIAIGGMDIMRSARTIAAEQFTYFIPLFVAGCYYYLIVILIEYISKKIEKKIKGF